MPFDNEELKKKIFYRSSYRGTMEMDILLSSFVKYNIEKFNNDELINLCDLLNIDDDNLYKFKKGLETQVKIPNNRITKLFKEYDYKKK